jgi:hypothetical protein
MSIQFITLIKHRLSFRAKFVLAIFSGAVISHSAQSNHVSFRAEHADFFFHPRSECRPVQSRNLLFLPSTQDSDSAIEESHA